ncbi:PAS domain-containing protein [Sphingobium estronivorans]|uniref:PAS domain-containing protein n=1 Tax=Sphingobium estronivorans TaxID=1577690 RepID=UPI00123BFD89|nr:PAS domain-containing protein [Sphingobium estronivorans]
MTTIDWSHSRLGAPAGWTSELRITVSMVMAARAPIILFWGPDYIAIYNDSFASAIGAKLPQAFGQPAREHWRETWNDLEPLLRGVRRTGEAFAARDHPLPIERSGRVELAYFDVSFSPVSDADGSIGGILAIVSETTNRMLAQQKLREKEAALTASEGLARSQADQLAAIYHASPVGLAVIDRELRYVRVNDRLAEWNGVPAEDHIGRTIAEIVPELTEQSMEVFRQVLAGKAIWGQEIAGPTRGRPDGEGIWRENWVPLHGENDAIIGIAVSCEDVTDERRAQRALELMNRVGAALAVEHDLERLVQIVTDAGVELSGAQFGAFFYNVVDGAGESYMLYSLSGAPREAFAQFPMPRNTQVFAPTFSGEAIVRSDDITTDPRYGKNAPRSGMPEGHLPVRSYLAVPVMARSGEVLGGLFFGHPDAGRFKNDHESLVSSLAGQAAVAIENARLIRQVREANETLEKRIADRTAALTQAHEALRHAQKMEAIGQLTGGVAHDFNNLLTVISGAAEMLQRPDLSQEKRDRYLDAIAASANRASTLTSHLLAFSRRRVIKPEVIDLNVQLDALGEMLSRSLGSLVGVEVKPFAGEAHVEVDPTELETAVLNAAVNARDAMPDGGSLT